MLRHRLWVLRWAAPAVVVAVILHSTFAAEPANPTASEKDATESDNLRGKPVSKKPLLVQMAEEHGYALAEGEDLKRIAPPFDPIARNTIVKFIPIRRQL